MLVFKVLKSVGDFIRREILGWILVRGLEGSWKWILLYRKLIIFEFMSVVFHFLIIYKLQMVFFRE